MFRRVISSVVIGGGFILGAHLSRTTLFQAAPSTPPICVLSPPEPICFFSDVSEPETSQTAQLQEISSHPVMRFGFPQETYIIAREGYVLSYDTRLRNARWVCEHLDQTSFSSRKSVTRELSTFREDSLIHPMHRATLADYKDTVFDRGHLAPAANHKTSQSSMNETFFLTNISPQIGNGFNRHYWARVEHFARDLLEDWEDVHICTGPLWVPKEKKCKDGKTRYYVEHEMIGFPPNVAVPTHFFKVIVGENHRKDKNAPEFAVGAFILPNARIHTDDPLVKYQVDKSVVDYLSGSILFPNLELVSQPPKILFTEIETKQETLTTTLTQQTNDGESKEETSLSLVVQSQSQTSEITPISHYPQIFRHSFLQPPVFPNICDWSSCELPPPFVWTPLADQTKLLLQEQVHRFSNDPSQLKLEFDPAMTPAERKWLHGEAERLGLKHYSVGGKADRRLVIEKMTAEDEILVDQ